ncbi:MAG: hypothetical protein ACXWPS_07600 [Ktedonobacteraceae bacterium]
MPVKLFVLGRPGSGKSEAYRQIEKYLQQSHKDWSVVHFTDYEILQEMFQFEKHFQLNEKLRKFLPREHGGFDVRDFSVLDDVLKELEKKIKFRYSDARNEQLIVIEFARDDYGEALKLFSPGFLKDAYFLFINSDINRCIQRVHSRVAHSTSVDDHFVSDDIICSYYKKQRIPFKLERVDSPQVTKVQVISSKKHILNNKGSQQDLAKKIQRLINRIIKHEELKERSLINGEAFTQWGYDHIFVRASELKMRALSLLRI